MQHPPPTIVIVIPFYNGASFIERSVHSAFTQTVAASEVIVVNDGSEPEERAALDVLAQRYPFRILDKSNGGQGSARNAGVAASTADFICFLDQDDFFLETHIETLIAAIPQGDPRLGFVYADVYEADVDGQIIRTSMVKAHASDHPKRSIFEMIAADMFVLPSASLIVRRAFEAVGGFDDQFMGFEDDDLFLRIFRAGFTNHFVDKAVTVWCIHTSSTSFGIRMIRSRFKYFRKLVGMFPDEPLRGRFYLRDYLVPRFGKLFVNDGIKSLKEDNQYRAEMRAVLDEYAAIVLGNPHVGRGSKLQLRTTMFLLKSTPHFMLKWIFGIVNGRVLRLLRRLLA